MKFKHHKRRRILHAAVISGILLTFIVIYISTMTKGKQPMVQNGVLDLTKWDFDSGGPVELDGEWEFYWNQLLTYDDFIDRTLEIQFGSYQQVPDVWNKYSVGGADPTGKGCATYRIKLKVADENEMLGLKIRTISTSYKVMVNDKLIASCGIVGDSAEEAAPEYNTQTVSFTPPAKGIEIIVQVSNFTYSRGGIWRPIVLGSDMQIRRLADSSSRREMFVFGVILIIFFYLCSLYKVLGKKKSVRYNALAFISIALRILVTGEYYITKLIPGIPFVLVIFLEYLAIYWGSAFWLLYMRELYPKEFTNSICKACICISSALTLFSVLAPIYIYTGCIFYIELYLEALFVYILIMVVIAAKRKRKDAYAMLLANIAIFCGCVSDAFCTSVLCGAYGAFVTAAFIVTAIQAGVLAKWYSRALNESREYSGRLDYLNNLKDEFLVNASHMLNTPINGMNAVIKSVIQDKNRELDSSSETRLKWHF